MFLWGAKLHLGFAVLCLRYAANDARKKETEARDLLDQSDVILDEAQDNYDEVQRKSTQLDDAMRNLQV